MNQQGKKKVLCPIEGRDGKTHWRTLGVGWINKDNSINLYLDGLPHNGRLQIRDWDEQKAESNPLGLS